MTRLTLPFFAVTLCFFAVYPTFAEGRQPLPTPEEELQLRRERLLKDLQQNCRPYLYNRLGKVLQESQLNIMCGCLVETLVTQEKVKFFTEEQWRAVMTYWQYGSAHNDILRARGLTDVQIAEVEGVGEHTEMILEHPTTARCVHKKAIDAGFIEPPEAQ